MKLRDYQTNSIKMLRDGFREGHRTQILQLSTGGGKTVIAAHIAKASTDKGNRVWFICDSIELINQTVATFEGLGLDVGVIQGNHERTDYRKPVQIITAQTITRRWQVIDANPDWRPDIIIADEIHVFYKAHREMMSMFDGIPFIGISATPWAKGLGKWFSNLIVGATTADLIAKGYLCNYVAYAPSTPDMTGVKTQAGDYKPDQLDKKVHTTQITASIVDTWLRLGDNRQTLCYCVNVAHSKSVAEEFRRRGVVAVHLDGYTDSEERALIIDKFKEGRINILCNCAVLTKGFDVPSATCLIIARPTKSLMLHIQIIGRVMRVSPCGKDALILDHSGNLSRLGWPDDEMQDELDDGKKVDQLKKKKDELEKELKAPKACPQCFCLHTEFKCPSCGFVPKIAHNVEEIKGELVKLKQSEPKKRNRLTSKEDKQALWSAFLKIANSKGRSSHLYRDLFGVWPRNLIDNISYATDESLAIAINIRTASRIRFAKGKK